MVNLLKVYILFGNLGSFRPKQCEKIEMKFLSWLNKIAAQAVANFFYQKEKQHGSQFFS